MNTLIGIVSLLNVVDFGDVAANGKRIKNSSPYLNSIYIITNHWPKVTQNSNNIPYYEAFSTDSYAVHHDVSITDIDMTSNTYKGVVDIDLDVTEPANK